MSYYSFMFGVFIGIFLSGIFCTCYVKKMEERVGNIPNRLKELDLWLEMISKGVKLSKKEMELVNKLADLEAFKNGKL